MKRVDKLPLASPEPDIDRFIGTITGRTIPERPPLAELFLDADIVRKIAVEHLGRVWVEPAADRVSREQFLRNWIEVYYRMGYDYVRVSGGLEFPARRRQAPDTAGGAGTRSWTEEEAGPIRSWEDFEKYPWPDPARSDLFNYEFVSRHLPAGMGLFVCPASGFLEIPLNTLLGYQNLSLLLYDNPALVAAVFEKVGGIITGFYRRLLGLTGLRGFFQGDDMGFKTGTLVSPATLREHVFPQHRKLCALAHEERLLYLLHSCGNLEQVMDDLIDGVGIDARHSFEDEGNPIGPFKEKYGRRIAVLGGVDIDKLCRLPAAQLRPYVRSIIDRCLPGGRFALGSGNSVANYVPLKNYFVMVEEGLNYGR